MVGVFGWGAGRVAGRSPLPLSKAGRVVGPPASGRSGRVGAGRVVGRSGMFGRAAGLDVGRLISAGRAVGRWGDAWGRGAGRLTLDWVIGFRLADDEAGRTLGRAEARPPLPRLTSRAMASVTRRGRQHSCARMKRMRVFMRSWVMVYSSVVVERAAGEGGRFTTVTVRSGINSPPMV